MSTYFLHHPDLGEPTKALYAENKVTFFYRNNITVSIEDTGNGYEVRDTSPGAKAKKVLIDYSLMCDIAAAMKIFAREDKSVAVDYWTIYRGEKL